MRRLSRKMFEFQDEANNLFKHAEENTDRSVCVIMSSMLERTIEICILHRIGVTDQNKVDLLFQENGALSSFSGNIDLAFALGLIDENLQKDCHTLRRIRNAFAHAALTITFETKEISDQIRKFKHLGDDIVIKTDESGAYISVTVTIGCPHWPRSRCRNPSVSAGVTIRWT